MRDFYFGCFWIIDVCKNIENVMNHGYKYAITSSHNDKCPPKIYYLDAYLNIQVINDIKSIKDIVQAEEKCRGGDPEMIV